MTLSASRQPGSYQVRMFPITLDALRADGIRNWDVKVLRRFRTAAAGEIAGRRSQRE